MCQKIKKLIELRALIKLVLFEIARNPTKQVDLHIGGYEFNM